MNTDKNKDVQESESKDSLIWPFVLAVIINWNGKDDVLECLKSMKKVNYPRDRFKILVVDNGSTDGSPTAITKTYPDISLKKNTNNLGYVHAVNQGVTQGLAWNADYIWICNNDIVVDKGALTHLVETGQGDAQIGVVAPIVYSYKNPLTIDNIGYKINFWIGKLKKLKYEEDIFLDTQSQISDVDSNLGCSNIIKTSLFQKIGMFRPIYRIYFEETDFNVRARRSGFRVVVARKAKVWHKTAATMDKFLFRRAYFLLRNLLIFEILNARIKHLLVFIPYFIFIHIPHFLISGAFYGTKVKQTNRKL
jgi:GT2 family glycosyltransferase